MTDFETICKILSEIHVAYTEEGDHADFAEFNDLGVPLAYFVYQGLAVPSQEGKDKILETWELLLKAQELEDTGFSELDDLLDWKEISDNVPQVRQKFFYIGLFPQV